LSAGDGDIEQDMFESLKSALSLAAENVSELLMPSGHEPPMDDRAGTFLLRKVQSESGKIRAALQGLVQSQTLNRSQHACRGRRMDGKRLHRLPLGETKLFQRKQTKAAPNTAIHLLLDKSESMGYPVTDSQGNPIGSRMPIALEATLALALAIEGIPGVNPGVTAFPGRQDDSVYRLLEHGQRVNARTGAFSLAAAGSTPMTEAIWFGAASLLRCRELRKVLMVMTDGQPNDTLSTLELLQRCRDSGIETVGVGLGLDVSHLFPIAITINDLSELRAQLFELSKAVLLAA
jgi:cobalamin biosynthesis protein CobT